MGTYYLQNVIRFQGLESTVDTKGNLFLMDLM